MRCLIVDNEPEGRSILLHHAECIPFLKVVGECPDAFTAMECLNNQEIDLLFLDIQMPGIDGLAFLRSLSDPPKVIFTTAYTDFAVEGFELDAVDYLLKPIPFERFFKAVNKARSTHEQQTFIGKNERFFGFKADKRTYRVPVQSICALESDGDYTHLYLEDTSYMLLGSLTAYVMELEDVLLRVHRSHAVNLKYLEYMEGNVIRIGGRDIPIGASYREEVRKRIK